MQLRSVGKRRSRSPHSRRGTTGRNLYFMHVIAVAWESTYVRTYACTRPLICPRWCETALTRSTPIIVRRQRLVARGILIAIGERCRVHYAPADPWRLFDTVSLSVSTVVPVWMPIFYFAEGLILFVMLTLMQLFLMRLTWRFFRNCE